MGVLKAVIWTAIAVTALTAIIILSPNLQPSIETTEFHIKPPKKPEGWFATNSILDEAEVYFEQENDCFESLAMLDENAIFIGNQVGNIIKVTGKQMATNITTLKFPCSSNPFIGTDDKKTCSWPLGMRFDKKGFLYVMDYFGGLTKIDVKSGKYENMIPKNRPINNKIAHVPEDLDIASDGSIYWSDGSSTGDFFYEMVGEPSGRLIRYDPLLQKNEVLMEKIYFSNGVCLSDNEEYVLVAEFGSARILRYYIAGKMKGITDVFVDSLPGYPDNIRSNGRGGFYVPLALPWNEEFSMNVHLLAPRPNLRKLILRSRHILLSLIQFAKTFLPGTAYLEILEKFVAQNEPILNMSKMPKTTTVVELSSSGEIF